MTKPRPTQYHFFNNAMGSEKNHLYLFNFFLLCFSMWDKTASWIREATREVLEVLRGNLVATERNGGGMEKSKASGSKEGCICKVGGM